jgi:osmotically-inducible protein OsmY
MTRSNGIVAVVCTLALTPWLQGCAVAVIGGVAAAGGVGYEAAQERGLNGEYDDVKTKANIAGTLAAQYGDITATVYWGRVLLTGSSPTEQQKSQAEQAVSHLPGVRAVYNEILVDQPMTPWDLAQDAWINARVHSDLVLDTDIRSGNYTVETDHRSVYLIGSARSQDELERAAQLARYVPGVQRVVSYVEIRSGVPGGAQPGLAQAGIPPAPTDMSQPPAVSPSSSAPIQVQKLP